ncbi:MAG TPA: hypothetical protein VK105_06985 [Virgibacillus sp.]|nr:hypothetical protein [Virgibacillus sp.]HLR66867.1 hypothetical protein [Virgibacillus sp.]
MEEKIENYIDSSLEGLEPFLYKLNVAGGIILIIIGLLLIIKNKDNSKRKMMIIGVICTGIGVLALSSGIMQMIL